VTQVHVKFGNEIETYPTIAMAAGRIRAIMRIRKLDAFVMSFWDENDSKSRRQVSTNKTTKETK
jgi:translation initiation factor IF-1